MIRGLRTVASERRTQIPIIIELIKVWIALRNDSKKPCYDFVQRNRRIGLSDLKSTYVNRCRRCFQQNKIKALELFIASSRIVATSKKPQAGMRV